MRVRSRFDTPIIVALDFAELSIAIDFAKRLDPNLCKVKVGKELFTNSGPAVVDRLQNLGFEVFLDLKFHDIPKTVYGAMKQAAAMGVWMVNVHAAGGHRMLFSAKDAILNFDKPPILVAVTVLTSMEQDDLSGIGIYTPVAEQVFKLAQLSKDNGLDGVVCSAQEAIELRNLFGKEFVLVAPGIRSSNQPADDQRRVVTASRAILSGVDYLVLGRSITRASDPLFELEIIHQELKFEKAP